MSNSEFNAQVIEQFVSLSEHELAAIIDNSPDGIVVFSRQGYIQSINTTFLNMTGFAAERLLGVSEFDFQKCLEQVSAQPVRVKNQTESQVRIFVIDGKKIRAHTFSRKYLDAKNSKNIQTSIARVLSLTERQVQQHTIANVLYFRDISAESEVDQMKSQFLSTAAHELRTPMASVFGFSELLLSREFDAQTTREILTTIHQQSESLVSMLNQLLNLTRIESRLGLDFSFVQQPLLPIVKRAVNELLLPGDPRQIQLMLPATDFQVTVDADKLRQVISNVLVNALKYSPDGGDINVSFKKRQRSNGVKQVGIIIGDHGIGMTAEQQKHIYDRFWRADNTREIAGTGLGMALVKEIMDIHQGQIDIKSQPTIGTSVTLWLNLC